MVFYSVLAVIFRIALLILFILMVIKFFQIARDVKKIAQNTPLIENEEPAPEAPEKTKDFRPGMLVVNLRNEEQMRIKDMADGSISCTKGGLDAGIFSPAEIMEFDEWVTKYVKK